MRVKDVMTENVITVDPKTPILDALEIMKENRVRRLPVVKGGKLKGMVTRTMIRDASPSAATSLSVHEFNYLLFKMTVSQLMVKKPVTVSPQMPVEEAIWLGMEHEAGGLPVMDGNKLVGMVTESDISRMVIDGLGVGRKDSRRITVKASGERYGFLRELVAVFDTHRMPILSMMGVPSRGAKEWDLIVRLKTDDVAVAVSDLRKKGYVVDDMD